MTKIQKAIREEINNAYKRGDTKKVMYALEFAKKLGYEIKLRIVKDELLWEVK